MNNDNFVFEFVQAEKYDLQLRLGLYGPSGSGKTYSALRIASGIVAEIGGKIAVIDTERRAARKYADRFNFSVLEMTQRRDIDAYIAAINAASKAGFTVLIIDSLTHAWQELLAEVETIARAKYHGNTWGAWSEGTPRQRRLVDAMLSYDGHVIVTMRAKTEWVIPEEGKDKGKPKAVGKGPEQGKGIEYELDMLGEITVDHIMCVAKDRTGEFQDAMIEKPGEDLGHKLAIWLACGKPEPQAHDQAGDNEYLALGQSAEKTHGIKFSNSGVDDMTADQLNESINALRLRMARAEWHLGKLPPYEPDTAELLTQDGWTEWLDKIGVTSPAPLQAALGTNKLGVWLKADPARVPDDAVALITAHMEARTRYNNLVTKAHEIGIETDLAPEAWTTAEVLEKLSALEANYRAHDELKDLNNGGQGA